MRLLPALSQGQQQSAEPTTLAAMVNLCVELQGFAPVPQPVKLRPGPPVSMHLSPGHPFKEQVILFLRLCIYPVPVLPSHQHGHLHSLGEQC